MSMFPLSKSDMRDIKDIARESKRSGYYLLCRIGLHRWRPWKIRADGHVGLPNGMIVGLFRDMQRKCSKCGKREARRIQWTSKF